MSVLKEVSLGDVVELEYRASFSHEISRIVGYVAGLDLKEIVLSTYDINGPKPHKYDLLTYQVKDVLSCTKLEKEN